jgi:flagellar basal-body rod protein FlgF
MSNAGYVGLSLQMALRQQMDVVANNVANLSTTGYKGEKLVFLEQLSKVNTYHAGASSQRLSEVADAGTYRDTSQGSFVQTGNPLDVALQGDGYLVVQAADGPRYTRAGGMQLNAERQLCDHNGYPIQGDGGPITIPVSDADIKITPTGGVVTESGLQGNLKLVRFANEQDLKAAAGGTYTTTDQALPSADTIVTQGGLEGSNVQPIVEMTRMIDLQRAYENVQNLLNSENDREKNAITTLANMS